LKLLKIYGRVFKKPVDQGGLIQNVTVHTVATSVPDEREKKKEDKQL
jgi:hypothetical protein